MDFEKKNKGPNGAPGGPGGPGGGHPGGRAIDLTGMLALDRYVFLRPQAVSAACYGIYDKQAGGPIAFAPVSAQEKPLAVYLDQACTKPASGVSAAVRDGRFTLTGFKQQENVVYYVVPDQDEKPYPTAIYVVGAPYAGPTAKLTLADDTTVALTTYAPNMACGDYDARPGKNIILGDGSVFLGGNRTAVTLADLTDPENFSANEAAAAWFLRSGLTNGGESLTTFGSCYARFELAVALYRLFQIVVEQTTLINGFRDPSDLVSAMFYNDQYADGLCATLNAGVWNGIYTRYSSVKTADGGLYFLENLPGVTAFEATRPVTREVVCVGLFNALCSPFAALNPAGQAAADAVKAAASRYDGQQAAAPADYTNAAKIAAVSQVLLEADPKTAASEGGEVLTKLQAVELLYAARNLTQAKRPPDEAFAKAVGSATANQARFFTSEYSDGKTVGSGVIENQAVISARGPALFADNIGGTLELKNATVSMTGTHDEAVKVIAAARDLGAQLDGEEAAREPGGPGFVYNAAGRNSFYRFAVGAGAAFWGESTRAVMTSDNGTLVLDGESGRSVAIAGNMAGVAYVGYGATLTIHNAVAYSRSQHLTNNLYNGTVHYLDAGAFGSGRVFSSDFWGGYQVFENTIAAGGSVTDETTTLIGKNSVYSNTLGGNGCASQYFQTSVLTTGTAAFQNTTSLLTDVGSLTLVGSRWDCTDSTLVSASKCEKVIVTLVDSQITLAGNCLAALDNTLNNPRPELLERFEAQVAVRLFGESTIVTPDGTLTAQVPQGSTLTIQGRIVDAAGQSVAIPGATMLDGPGTLVVQKA